LILLNGESLLQKMKMKSVHIVPLSKQTLAILNELHPLTGDGKYVFPGIINPDRPMSDNTVTSALRRLGYTSDEMTAHGFRSMACTLLNEHGWNRDAIERQLAHAGTQQCKSRIQLCRVFTRAQEDDAGLGRLFTVTCPA
jgi:integrase